MSDRDERNAPSTRTAENNNESPELKELEQEVILLNREIKRLNNERDVLKQQLSSTDKKVITLEDQRKKFLERLDKIEQLIVTTLKEE